MKDYIGTHIPANWYRGKQFSSGEISFNKTGIILYRVVQVGETIVLPEYWVLN